jgi:hypothetical protein
VGLRVLPVALDTVARPDRTGHRRGTGHARGDVRAAGRFIAELFSTELRYSGASMGYQIAGVLGGGIAPLVSIALAGATGTAFAVSFYVLAMLVLTLVALWAAPETARENLHDHAPARPHARRG